MKFFKSARVAALGISSVSVIPSKPANLKLDNDAVIRGVAGTIAHGAMSYYTANNTDSGILIGDLPEPYYWWQAGGLWGAMLDYYHYTGDPTYNDVVTEALTARVNTGENFDYVPIEHRHEQGNDDLFFWGCSALSAAERNFPQPKKDVPSWLDMAKNVFDSLESRWNNTHCGGGLLWQMYPDNPNGLNYKNSVTNGGFFQLAARLGRITGDSKYLSSAEATWDWSKAIGFVDDNYRIFDGADARDNCSITNPLSFSYSTGIYLYGAAVMADVTGDKKWADRAHAILDSASFFFKDGIMYEPACETVDRCNQDMRTFKGYLSRFMWQSTYMLPDLMPKVRKLLERSALAATATCTGGETGDRCGMRWYEGAFDGRLDLGHQMSVLEVVQGLLIGNTKGPLKGDGVKRVM